MGECLRQVHGPSAPSRSWTSTVPLSRPIMCVGSPSHRRRKRNARGRALTHSALDRCDRERLPAYNEASSERRAALAERLGFRHDGVYDLPDGRRLVGSRTGSASA